MGCGSSTDKGRDTLSSQSGSFFPPVNTEPESRSIPLMEGINSSNNKNGSINKEPVPVPKTTVTSLPSNGGAVGTTSATSDVTPVKNNPQQTTAKKKKPDYIPPSPITAPESVAEDRVESGTFTIENEDTKINKNSNNNTTSRNQSTGSNSAQRTGYPPVNTNNTYANNETTAGNDEQEEEDYGELIITENHPGDISVVSTDPDLRSEIPVSGTNNAPSSLLNKGNNSNSNNLNTSTNLNTMAEGPYVYEYPDDSPDPSSESGMRFDELYRLKGVLGTGAFSTVREGFHKSDTNISYAVKCINRKKLTDEDEAALLDEVSILKEMKHPHIIRLFDFFVEAATYYLVMERMRGGELFDRIVAKAYYNEKEARDTCRIILRAVEYCHSNHVAHRDLKPENLLLLSETDDSAVKIADFGFAKKVFDHNSLTTQCGTPGYVAPEILQGTAYDERADMWSVGVILYILLGGYPPFIESTQRDLFRKIRKGEYEFHEEYWGTVSQDAKMLISSLLTVSASDRLTAKKALDNAWIQGDDTKLASRDLNSNLAKLRNFNAKRKFRAAVSIIIAVNKLTLMGPEFISGPAEGVEEAEAKIAKVQQMEKENGGGGMENGYVVNDEQDD